MNSPKVSVIIPTYNRCELLPLAIESVLNQTFSDLEIIVVDDGSTDATRESIQLYLSRIQHIYQPNRGVSAARNTGIRASRGEWIAFLDADDQWHPSKLEQQLHCLTALGDAFGACCTDCDYIVDDRLLSSAFADAALPTPTNFGAILRPLHYLTPTRYAICIQSLLVRRSLLLQLNGFDESLGIFEDRDLTFRLSFLTSFCYVAYALVSIDRNPHRSRLTQFCSSRTDQTYLWTERLLTKLLAHPELHDVEVRHQLESELCALYFDWTSTRLSTFQLATTLEPILKLRRLGHGYPGIISTLISRAAAKFSRALRPLEAPSS